MRQKNKYLIEVWYQNTCNEYSYYKRKIQGNAELIWWRRKLKIEKKRGAIETYEITKIE